MYLQNIIINLLPLILLLIVPRGSSATDACIYDSSPKGIIDLSSVGRKDGTPRWKLIVPQKPDDHGKS